MGLTTRGAEKAEKVYTEKLSRLDEEQQDYVDGLVHNVWNGDDLTDEEQERLEEYDATDAFQAGLTYAYVSLMRDGTEGLFHGDVYAPDTEKTKELWKTRVGQYHWVSKKHEDAPLPRIPEDDYETARDKYAQAEDAFHKASHVETYLADESKTAAKQDLKMEYAAMPTGEEEEDAPNLDPAVDGPIAIVAGAYKVYNTLKTVAKWEHFKPAATDHPEEKEQEAAERRKTMEQELEAMREELESLHADQ